ncbi:MAG: type VI secretion system contractile sheath large subunit [Desulfovibrio sp.]|nr:type VI secretion system contractile sheath large subunit [Desulfovibrio sp.]
MHDEKTSPLEAILTAAQAPEKGPERDTLTVGLRTLLRLAPPAVVAGRLSDALPDYIISMIDDKLSAQLNAILHHPDFLALEAAWRALYFLVDRIDFSQNIKVEYINVSKTDLLNDFHDAPEVVKSGLYHHVYTAEFGQFGGQPVAAIIADYEFNGDAQDMQLLSYAASVACMSHAPFFAAAGKGLFGIDAWRHFPDLTDIKSVFDTPRLARWNSFRESENARYVGLTLPGFLLRRPYNEDAAVVSAFNFIESTESEDNFCWGNTAFALGVCLADSFAKYRWCVNIIGPDGGGAVTGLPCCSFDAMRGIQNKIPTRTLISERREFELADLGFITFAADRNAGDAIFYSANSVLKPKLFPKTPEGFTAEINFKLSTQFPYMMIMNRLGHYIKVIQRESVGAWRECADIARELNKWTSQYVTEMDTPDALTRSRRPLRMARIDVKEVPGDSGWYAVTVLACPHFKYMGVNFTLSLEGKLDRQSPEAAS